MSALKPSPSTNEAGSLSFAIMNVIMSVSCFSFWVPAKNVNKYRIVIKLKTD